MRRYAVLRGVLPLKSKILNLRFQASSRHTSHASHASPQSHSHFSATPPPAPCGRSRLPLTMRSRTSLPFSGRTTNHGRFRCQRTTLSLAQYLHNLLHNARNICAFARLTTFPAVYIFHLCAAATPFSSQSSARFPCPLAARPWSFSRFAIMTGLSTMAPTGTALFRNPGAARREQFLLPILLQYGSGLAISPSITPSGRTREL